MVGPFLGFGGHTMRIRLFPPYYSCRYSTSPVADWLDDFAQWLKVTGYTRTPMRGHISILRWALERRAPVPRDTHFSHADLRQLFGSSKKPRLFRATRRVFERFLRSRGQWIEQPSTDRHAVLLDAYRAYLLEMRGLSAMSVYHHTATAAAFLKKAAPSTRCLAAVSVEDTERFVAASAQRFGHSGLQQRIGYLRSFLRFCHDRGVVRRIWTRSTRRASTAASARHAPSHGSLPNGCSRPLITRPVWASATTRSCT